MSSQLVDELIRSTSRIFGELGPGEQVLLRTVGQGKALNFSQDYEAAILDLANSEHWDSGRTIRAELLGYLIRHRCRHNASRPSAVIVRGAYIVGRLPLTFIQAPFMLALEACIIPDGIEALDSSWNWFSLKDSKVGNVNGIHLEVRDSCDLRVSTLGQAIRLLDASIGGNIIFSGDFSADGSTPAIQADRITVGGNVQFERNFHAHGEVSLIGARVAGQVTCEGKFESLKEGKAALSAVRAHIEGDLIFGQYFAATGITEISGMIVGGYFSCAGASFSAPAGLALNATRIRIGASALVYENSRFEGGADFSGARIEGDFSWTDCLLLNEAGVALDAHSVFTGKNAFFNSAQIHGSVDLSLANVSGLFAWRKISGNRVGTLDLRLSSVAILRDDQESWPQQIQLHGFTYQQITEDSPTSAADRTDWLERSPAKHFLPQPYTLLANVLAAQGHDEFARGIRIARESKRRRQMLREPSKHPLRFASGLVSMVFLGWTIAYGYRPTRAIWLLITIWFFGMLLFQQAERDDYFVPSREPESAVVDLHAPTLFVPAYTLDLLIPFLDLQLETEWRIDARAGKTVLGTRCGTLTIGGMYLVYQWLHIILGWTFSTLFVAGFAGLVRRE